MPHSSVYFQGVIAHEIAHALGFVHVHQRPDRNGHIRIVLENILSSKFAYFREFDDATVKTLGVPYDYTSVLHYRHNVSR